MNISNCNTILYNGDIIQEISYRGSLCYSLMRMYIVYEDGSPCALVDFNSLNCTTWRTLVNMYPDVFRSEFSTIKDRYIIYVNATLLKDTPNGYHYSLRNGNGNDVYIDDEIVFDSSNSTTYILQLAKSGGATSGGGSN